MKVKPTTHFSLKMTATKKDLLTRAAALTGTTTTGFVRSALKEKAQQLVDRDALFRLSIHEMDQFSRAIQGAFKPNKALQAAMKAAAKVQRA